MITIRDLFISAWLCQTSLGTPIENGAKQDLFRNLDKFLMQNRKEEVEGEPNKMQRICTMVSLGYFDEAYSLLQEEVL